MKQLVGMKGPYKDWSEDRRRGFLSELIEIIASLEATKVGCVVSVNCFKQLPQQLQKFFDEPYFMACQQVIRGCGICGLAIEGQNDQVHFTIAEQLEYGAVGAGTFVQDQAGKVHKLWKAVKEMTDFGPPLATYRAGSPRSIEALQAADLFAYELVREYESRETAPTRPMRWALRKILNDTLWSSSLLKFYSLDTMLLTLIENGVIRDDQEIQLYSAHIQLANKLDMHRRSSST